jgi:hypothetical protein
MGWQMLNVADGASVRGRAIEIYTRNLELRTHAAYAHERLCGFIHESLTATMRSAMYSSLPCCL